MQEINGELEYHNQRLELEKEWRDTQLELDQERRICRRWWTLAFVLIGLFASGVAGGTYLSSNWYWLTGIAVIGIITFIVTFISYGIKTLTNSWKLQGKVIDIKNKQVVLKDVWLQRLAIQNYGEYYRQILIPQVVEEYQKNSRVNRILHLIFQMSVIVTSLLVTGLTSGLDIKMGLNIPWLAPILSFLVSLFTAVMGFFKFRERSFHMQQTADSIELEKADHELKIRHYKNYKNDLDAAFSEFAERVQSMREEQTKRQQQLGQASESKET